ncbi:MAG: L,D-transpeptidase family protein [Ilumatobacteraceae bacterium]
MSADRPEASVDVAVYTRRRLLVASAVALIPAAVYLQLRSGAATPMGDMPFTTTDRRQHPVPGAPEMAKSTAAMTVDDEVRTTTANTAVRSIDHPIGRGMNGDDVRAVQDGLREMGFDPGPSDGLFGPSTEMAVWAFEKFIIGTDSAAVTGVVSSEMWVRMRSPIDVRPRRLNSGTSVEILLPEQIAVVYQDSRVRLITHVSSGTGEEWCDVVSVDGDDGSTTEQGICGIATTPGGMYHFERRVAGWSNSKLGQLYNPVFFNYGIAIHGALNVPRQPASHGCVRVPMHIAQYFPTLVANGDLVYVFDGRGQPETYGAQLPVFDYADPRWVAPTTVPASSTSIVSATAHEHPPTSAAATTTNSPSMGAGGALPTAPRQDGTPQIRLNRQGVAVGGA